MLQFVQTFFDNAFFSADCDGLDASWASINNGVLICSRCAGIHRSLGVEYSFVQSVKLDGRYHHEK